MELLHPAFFGVHQAQFVEDGGFEFFDLLRRDGFAGAEGRKDIFDFGIRVIGGVDFFEAVVGQPASVGVEVILPFAYGGQKGVEAADIGIGQGGEFIRPCVE